MSSFRDEDDLVLLLCPQYANIQNADEDVIPGSLDCDLWLCLQ